MKEHPVELGARAPVPPPFDTQWLACPGINDHDLARALLNQALSGVADEKTITPAIAKAVMAALEGVAPRDSMEAMLAVQASVLHHHAMRTFARAHSTNIPDVAERHLRMAAKLAGVFTTQMQALAKYRQRGQQQIRVEHVHVHEGGQAIVGNVAREVGG